MAADDGYGSPGDSPVWSNAASAAFRVDKRSGQRHDRPRAMASFVRPGANGPPNRPRPSPFIGRGLELAVLRELLTAARRGGSGIVLLSGEPGVGKTRLVKE